MTPREREILIYSYYRDAELRGSNLIYRMLRFTEDPESQLKLTEQLADETRHAWLWTELIRDLGGAPLQISDGYQVRIGKRVGVPRDLVKLFALTVVVEQRALRRYAEHQRRPDTPEHALRVLDAVSRDEGWHIDWMRRKGREFAEGAGDAGRFDSALAAFREVDREVTRELEQYERSLIPA